MLPIDGFDMGNSPAAVHVGSSRGTTVLLTTTNGTRALLAAQGAARRGRRVVRESLRRDGHAAHRAARRHRRRRSRARDRTDITRSKTPHAPADSSAQSTKRLSGIAMNDAAHSCALLARSYGDEIGSVFLDSSHGRALVAGGIP